MRPSERAALVGIVAAIGLLLRIGHVASGEVVLPLRADAGQYAQYAHNLVAHGTYSLSTAVPPAPDSFRSPGYPLFLAGCRWLAGEGGWYPLARWLQAVLGALLVPITWLLARTVLPFGTALGAAILVAASPHLIFATGYVLTEALFAVVLTAAFALLAFALRAKRSRPAMAAAGFAFGVASLINESMAPLPLLLAAVCFRRCDRRAVVLFAAMALLPICAWSLRNHSQPLARTGADRAVATLSHGSYPGLFFATEEHRGEPYKEDPEQPAFGASWARCREVLGRRIAERPWRYLGWYLLEKPVWVWSHDLAQGTGAKVYPVRGSLLDEQPVLAGMQTLLRWLHLPFCLLGLAGLFVSLRSLAKPAALSLPLSLLAVAMVWFTAVPTVFLPDARYLVPLRPVQAVLAAAAVTWLLGRWRRRGAEAGAGAGAVATAAGAISAQSEVEVTPATDWAEIAKTRRTAPAAAIV